MNKEIKRINHEKNSEIEKRDSVIDDLNKEIKRIDEEKNSEIKRLTEEKNNIIKNLNDRLQEIIQSKGYKVLTKIHKIRKKIGLI